MFRSVAVLAALLTAAPVSAQMLSIACPKPSATVAQSFTVQGASAGIDAIHVWGFPQGQPAVFLGSVAPTCPPPGAGSFCDYSLVTAALAAPIGTYPVVVYGHDPVTNTFNTQQQVTVDVTKGPNISSGFGVGSYVNAVDLDEAFTIFTGGSVSGGVILFGSPSASPRTCVAQVAAMGASVSTTRTHATISISGSGSLAPIQVLCGGGR